MRNNQKKAQTSNVAPDGHLISRCVERVIVRLKELDIILRGVEADTEPDASTCAPARLKIAFAPNLPRRKGVAHAPTEPASIDPATRDALLRAIARARGWMEAILAGRIASFDDIAAAESLAERHVRRLAPLAFLSPTIIEAITDGDAPAGLTVSRHDRTTGAILKNRFYIGEVAYRSEAYRGEHEPILDRDLFDAVQARLAERAVRRKMRRSRSPSLLMGLIFDDRGNPMSPSHANKKGVRYRYYVSQALLQNRKSEAGSVSRVSGPDIENIVVAALRHAIADRNVAADSHDGDRRADASERDRTTTKTTGSPGAAASPDSDRAGRQDCCRLSLL
jgi:Recombinase